MESVSFSLAFIAGLITFFTPCIFPLIPSYIAFIAGLSLNDIGNKKKIPLIAIEIFSFLIGLSLIFIILGYSAGGLGKLVIKHKEFIRLVGGGLAIILGIQFILDKYIISLGFKSNFKTKRKNLPLIGSFLLGFSFGLGWSPCIGPTLTTILLYATSTENPFLGASLLLTYGMGFCIPLLITGITIHKAFDIFGKITQYLKPIRIISGIVLILMGISMITH
ncbi:MAG: cytochrome c biogenesis protein CcdA [Synergistetes bacterium]|nr:cytochrome c biogenesis protein CcdA [Synergistota bacterium]MCX8128030.1 cytochrome c biogenesis protein CcdA [Synergistota bacterium]MDW8193068.1 cytochrome c biogenesis protein CcdA [Synergistota bacterium]